MLNSLRLSLRPEILLKTSVQKKLFSQAENQATSGKDSELIVRKKNQQLALQKAEILDS